MSAWVLARSQANFLAVLIVLGAGSESAVGQMTIPTTGVLPTGTLNRSLILGDDLASFQASWVAPVNTVQQSWVNQINSQANGSVSASAPTSYSAAASQAAIAEAAGLRFAMTGNVSDLNKTVTALLAADVPGGTFITRPEVVTSYLAAYDFIRGATSANLSTATRAAIESRLVTLTTSLDDGNLTYSNARGKTGGTRAMAGVILQNQSLLDQGLADLSGHFNYSTTDDGWFADSPGHYLNYTLRHISYFARVYEQGSGVDLSANLRPYIDMAMGLRLPDGTLPNVANGLVIRSGVSLLSQSTDPEAASLAMWNLTSGDPANYNGYSGTNILNNVNAPTTFFALVDFQNVTPEEPTTSPTFLTDGQSKVSVFRQDWSTTSDYLLMSAGIDSPGSIIPNIIAIPAFHTHNDSMEIVVASKGELILPASGYFRDDLSNSPTDLATQLSDSHNVILVDGNVGLVDPSFAVQSPIVGRLRRPEDFVHSNRLDSTEFGQFKGVSDFASLETVYNETTVRRNTAFAGEDYFVVADRMDGDANHTYAFNLVGRGTQTVLLNSPTRMEVRWELNGSQVIEHLFSTADMSLLTDTKWMHVTFNQFETTYRMMAEIEGTDELFLSVIETGFAGDPSALFISQLSTSPDSLGILIEHLGEGWQDTILSQFGHSDRSAGDLTSDANYAYMREMSGMIESMMMAEGTYFEFEQDRLVELNNRSTLSLLFQDDVVLGTVSDDGLLAGTELTFFGRGAVTAAWLDGQAISFVNGGSSAYVILTHGGELRVEFSAVPELSSTVLILMAGSGAWLICRMSQTDRHS